MVDKIARLVASAARELARVPGVEAAFLAADFDGCQEILVAGTFERVSLVPVEQRLSAELGSPVRVLVRARHGRSLAEAFGGFRQIFPPPDPERG